MGILAMLSARPCLTGMIRLFRWACYRTWHFTDPTNRGHKPPLDTIDLGHAPRAEIDAVSLGSRLRRTRRTETGQSDMLQRVLACLRGKSKQPESSEPEPESYEEMAERAMSVEDLLAQQGVNVEKVLQNFSEFVERVEQAASAKIVHGSAVPMTGSVHIGLDRVTARRDVERDLRR